MNPLASILDKDKLTGPNFLDWRRKLKIVLDYERLYYVLDMIDPDPIDNDSSTEKVAAYHKWESDELKVRSYIKASMSSTLQEQYERVDSSVEIMEHLQELYGESSETARYDVTSKLFRMKMKDGTPVSDHVLQMINLIDQTEAFDLGLTFKIKVDLILQSLTPAFKGFISNFNMNKLIRSTKSLSELHGSLKTYEKTENILKVEGNDKGAVLAVSGPQKGKKKKKGKKQPSKKFKPTGGISKKGKEKKVQDECFHCKKKGHWKRNCPQYLASLKKPKEGTSTFFVIELNLGISSISHSWILDSAATSHICMSPQILKSKRLLKEGEVVLKVGNGELVTATTLGTCHLPMPSRHLILLDKVLHFPSAIRNIVSIPILTKCNYEFHFINNKCNIYYLNKFFGIALNVNGLYVLQMNENHNKELNTITTKRPRDNPNSKFLWHLRLGHIGDKRISKLEKEGMLPSLGLGPYPTCESCLKGKMTKSPFVGQNERAKETLELIHSDVCGPLSIVAKGGFQYFVIFTDDCSRFGYLYLMKHKSETFEKFKEFKNEVENQLGKSIKNLRSDRGGEYLSTEFQDYLKEHGIVSQVTPPYTPQHNGVSERRNRTLLDMVRSMMSFVDIPTSFWGYALQTALHVLNRVPTKSAPKTPYEIWYGKRPNLGYLKIWGSPAYVRKVFTEKLDSRSEKGQFIGYPKDSMGYYFYIPSDHKIVVSRNATFLEDRLVQEGSTGKEVDLDEEVSRGENSDQIDMSQKEQNPIEQEAPQETQPLRRSVRESRMPLRYTLVNQQVFESFMIGEAVHVDDPRNYEEAMSDIDSSKWLEAMNSEMDSMYSNQVWTLVDPPEGINPIGCKWVFKRKIGKDGKVETYKARLVAKGYTQKQGVDYEETFSPVAMLKSIRILLAIAAYYDYEIWQMDVKTAFLNGFLEEEIYMKQPEGFTSRNDSHKVCKLQRSIYGLKQASRSWNLRFDDAIKTFGFIKNVDEPCVYKKVGGSAIVFLILYVDDILLLGNDVAMMTSVKVWLSKTFSMKDLGEATYILGIRIYRDRSRRMIGLSQSIYIEKVLKRFNMLDSKRGLLPCRHGIHLSRSMSPKTPQERARMSQIPYASAIGSLMYAMLCTRPDIAFAVSVTSRFQSDPGENHWIAVKAILKYLRRTKDMILTYGSPELKMDGFTDSDFQTDTDDYKSTSGFVFLCNGGAVSWKSSKQSTIADSTTEAEYIAASEAAKEAVWMKKFITELGVVPSIEGAFPLNCDNNGAIAQAKEPRSHQKSKHIQRKYHILREYVGDGQIIVQKTPSADNVADPLTKPMSQEQLERHLEKMGIGYHNNWL